MTKNHCAKSGARISPIQEQFEREFDFIHAFERNARHFAKKVAVSDPTTNASLTYSELDAEANKLANALAAAGLKKGDAFGVALFNTIEFVVAYVASENSARSSAPLTTTTRQTKLSISSATVNLTFSFTTRNSKNL